MRAWRAPCRGSTDAVSGRNARVHASAPPGILAALEARTDARGRPLLFGYAATENRRTPNSGGRIAAAWICWPSSVRFTWTTLSGISSANSSRMPAIPLRSGPGHAVHAPFEQTPGRHETRHSGLMRWMYGVMLPPGWNNGAGVRTLRVGSRDLRYAQTRRTDLSTNSPHRAGIGPPCHGGRTAWRSSSLDRWGLGPTHW